MRLIDREEPFLKEISAHPDDDHPRLVFADWLEEQGDPRGRAATNFKGEFLATDETRRG